jgi:hypothetical protein
MRAREDWGVPNWLDSLLYPSYSGSGSGNDWAWQFLRRNKQYREFWTKKVFPFIREDGTYDDRYFKAELEGPSTRGEAKRDFGLLWGPHDPRNAKAPLGMENNAVREVRGWQCNPSPNTMLNLDPFEIAYVFDLRLPLAEQFSRALEVAKNIQSNRKERGLTVAEFRMRADKYVQYLRLIDGEDTGAGDAEIGAVLFAEKSDEYPDRNRTKALDYARRRAHALRDGGYRTLTVAL